MDPQISVLKNKIENKMQNNVIAETAAGIWTRAKAGEAPKYLTNPIGIAVVKLAAAEVAELKTKIGRQTAAIASAVPRSTAAAAPTVAPATAAKPAPAAPLTGLARAIQAHRKA